MKLDQYQVSTDKHCPGCLIYGGTPIDDGLLDMLKLSELAQEDPELQAILEDICDEIASYISEAMEKKNGRDTSRV